MSDSGFSVEGGTWNRVNALLGALDELAISNPDDYRRRCALLETLYTELYPELKKSDANVDNANAFMKKLKEELAKLLTGKKQSHFIDLSYHFERNLRDFVHNNIKNKKGSGFYG